MPLHPDKCGGLGSISKYTTTVSIVIGAIGIFLSAATIYEVVFGSFEKAVPVILGIFIYFIFSPLFFFLPLGTAHDSMHKAKEEELLDIAQKYQKSYDRIKSFSEYSEDYEEEFRNFENIKNFYEVANSFPVWPFDPQNLKRFFAIITTPVAPAIISIIETLISNWIGTP